MIERLETVRYALRFRKPYVTARGRLEQRELLLVQLRCDGAIGLGEAAPLALRGGASLQEMEQELDDGARPLLEGASFDPSHPDELLVECTDRGVSAGLCALELALLDLAGKLRGEPVWRLLGAARAAAVPCNATLVAGPPHEVAEDALEWAERGFRSFKLKVGVDGDVEQVRAVRDAVGPDARLRVDANGVWSRDEAAAKLAQLGPLGLELAEQPAPGLEDLAAVRMRTEVPIAADESVSRLHEAREAAALGACDCVTVKIAKVGGLAAGRAIAGVLPTYLSSALDGPIGIAAAAHLAQVLPDDDTTARAHGLATAELFADRVASVECEVKDAQLVPSDAPGFGVDIDEDALARARLD
jgi:o-succinylbenzoate synthase